MRQLIKVLIIVLCLFSCALTYYPKDNANIFLNGKRINTKAPFLINNNRLCIPLNEFSDATGFGYKKEGSFYDISDKEHRTVRFLAEHDQVLVDDVKYYMPNKTFFINQVLYVPLGYYAWYLGYTMNRQGNNYYVSKRLVDIKVDNEEIRIRYACSINEKDFSLRQEGDGYVLDLKDTVLSFPRKILSNLFSEQIVIGQITTMPDLVRLSVRSDKTLFLRKEGSNELIISLKQGNKEKEIIQKFIPEDVESIEEDKVSDKAVWIPSFENVSNIILSVKGQKNKLAGKAIYKNGKYLVPAEKLLLPFGFGFSVSLGGNLLIRYGDKQEIDTKVKSFIINDEVYVPLQDLAKKLGFGLRWDYRIHTLFVNPIINNVSFTRIKEGDGVLISSFVEIEPKEIFELKNPHRIIVDIPNAVLDVNRHIIKVKDSNIEYIKTAQFDEETVRVVIQVKKPSSYGIAISDDSTKVKVLPTGRINSVWYQPYEKYNLLTIYGDDVGNISWNQNGKVLEIDVPNANYKAKGVYYFNDYYLDKIVGSQYSWDPVSSKISVYFKVTPKLEIKQIGDKLEIKIDNSKGDAVYKQKQVISPRETPVSLRPLSGKKIVVEAGHGGYDVGAIGVGGKYEKWFTLDTANRIKEELSLYGATVLMPLVEDKHMSLSGRTQFANRNNADLYISVHFNSFINERARGISTFFYSYTSQLVALKIQKELVAGLGLRNNGIKQARLFVLFHTKMPAVLIEPGFLSNRYEYDMLLKAENRDKIAKAVAKGVIAYYKGK